jgi:hypothetical protein
VRERVCVCVHTCLCCALGCASARARDRVPARVRVHSASSNRVDPLGSHLGAPAVVGLHHLGMHVLDFAHRTAELRIEPVKPTNAWAEPSQEKASPACTQNHAQNHARAQRIHEHACTCNRAHLTWTGVTPSEHQVLHVVMIVTVSPTSTIRPNSVSTVAIRCAACARGRSNQTRMCEQA